MMRLIYFFIITLSLCTSCSTQRVSTIAGSDYNKSKNQTNYFVLPYGTTYIPGKWSKTKYNEISRQQFFINDEGITIAIAFNPINEYEFNVDNSKKGFEFIEAFFAWESEYFANTHKFNIEKIEEDKSRKFIIWRAFKTQNDGSFDTYFLLGEKNGVANNFSISITLKLSRVEKIELLKKMYLGN
jgi:hypothetical protein